MNSDARSHRRNSARGRALLAFGVLAGVSGLVLAVTAFGGGADSEVVLDVEDAVAVSSPGTVPPLAAAPTETVPAVIASEQEPAPPASGSPPPTAPPVPTVPLSPLAELLGERGSAVPPAQTPRAQPISIVIDDLQLSNPVRTVGLRDDGALEVPDATEVGWYRYGAAPGQPGATVLAAHVSWNGDLGPFYELGDLRPGATVKVELDDGTERVYEVIERTMYDKDSLPRERIWRTTGDETLVLITCGGSFNPEIRRYRQNIVVYAVPIG